MSHSVSNAGSTWWMCSRMLAGFPALPERPACFSHTTACGVRRSPFHVACCPARRPSSGFQTLIPQLDGETSCHWDITCLPIQGNP